jgi:uncharacterized protein (TIGR00725 family)
MRKLQIAVIGSAWSQEYYKGWFNFEQLYDLSYQVGQWLAQQWCIVITGGKTGIMEWAAKWARDSGGLTIWFVKGADRWMCNDYTDVEIVTNMWDWGDGFLIPYSADGAIILGWWVGTLKEISWFYLQGKPLVALLWSWGRADKLGDQYLDEREIIKIMSGSTAQECVDILLGLISSAK